MTTTSIPQPAEVLSSQIHSALNTSPHLPQQKVQFKAEQGRVRLEGQVASYFQKQIAQEVVLRLDGVEEIENLLEVTWA